MDMAVSNNKSMLLRTLTWKEEIYLIAANKFCKQRIEISQMPSENLLVHIAHAFKHLKNQKSKDNITC